jgi:tight adherence protein B
LMSGVGWLMFASAALLVPNSDRLRSRLGWLERERIGTAPAGLLEITDASLWREESRSRRELSSRALGSRVSKGRVLSTVAAVALAVLLAVFVGMTVCSLALTTYLVLGRCWRLLADDRLAERSRSDLCRTVAALQDECAGGASTPAALSAVAPAAGGHRNRFLAAARAAAGGGDPATAFEAGLGDGGLRAIAMACRVSTVSGAALGLVLQGALLDLEADRTVRRTVTASLTGPRTSAALLALLPLVGFAMGFAMGADPVRILLHTPVGLASLTIGTLLDLAGLVWTVTATRRAQP